MRLFPITILGLLFASVGCTAQENKESEPVTTNNTEANQKLTIGDPAPAITGAKYLKGQEIKFEKGKVYVVEFWATWCGPCIKSMPHLATLLEEYKQQGLNVVAVTTQDEHGNTEEAVNEFIKTRGSRLPFTFAFCTTPATNDAFMEASGTDGIPASFVVDQNGKIAFIGHPMELDDVLPRVFAGTWNGKASIAEIEKEKEELEAILNKVQEAASSAEKANEGQGEAVVTKAVADAAAVAAAAVLDDLANYAKKHPIKAKQPIFDAVQLAVTLQARKFPEAGKISETLIQHAIEKKDAQTLNRVRSMWLAKAINPDRKSMEYAIRASEELLKLEGHNDISSTLGVAEAYYAAGNKEKGQEYGNKALELAGNDQRTKEAIEKVLKKFQE